MIGIKIIKRRAALNVKYAIQYPLIKINEQLYLDL